ncbi:RHS repeat-associated core domain-containing protein [Streptomyces zagrosensis]|uniref:RHS repeat-associated protein n=1 Tax=Streptomyces zagrosensis TaxID=1042984 RepID=A0A7W9QHS3_9ACTN|nr:RHS repeat-associated core domain-containing protein [Streptomyces zagrosensis]MBB5939217.1 RHS repeat-associated protein [Streptomyces zagrosensis]
MKKGQLTYSYAYGPTGLPRATPTERTPQPCQYAGTYKEPTGLYTMGARYYDPHLARFPTRPFRPGNHPLPLRHRRPHQRHRPARTLRRVWDCE